MPFCISCGSPVAEDVHHCAMCMGTEAPVTRFRCTADGTRLLVLYLKTLILSVFTLGIYSFWGRTEIRRYLADETWAGEDRFSWHGTGWELFIGWLKALGCIVLFYTAYLLAYLTGSNVVRVIATVILYLGFIGVVPLILVARTRYRLSRTSLRGVRFSSTARLSELARIYYGGLLLVIVTLGFYLPWFTNNITGYLTKHARWGDRSFDFDGEGAHLFGAHVIWLVLLFPTLYLISFWYVAKQSRYFWGHTSFERCAFSCSIKGRQLLWTALVNIVTIAITLGLAYPWAVLRSIRLKCDTLELRGALPFETVRQASMAATATGEGASSLLDIDGDIGGGFDF